MNRCGDVAVDELKTVVAMSGSRLGGEAEFMQRPIEPVARAIAGKDAAGSITTVRRGGEADNQQSRVGSTEAGYRTAPVFPVSEPPDLLSSYSFPILHQAWTSPAIDDLILG